MIITIDCGTTNLRARLFDGDSFLGEVKHKTGTRLVAFDGNTLRLEASLRDAIRELLDANNVNEKDIEGRCRFFVNMHTVWICFLRRGRASPGG